MRWLLGAAVAACACGGQTTDVGDAGDASADVAKDGGIPNKPPPPDSGTPTTVTGTYAIDTLFLGEAPRDGGAPSNTAWKAYGYNIDGLVTAKSDTNVCKLVQGAPLVEQVDGYNGIDNAWGSTLLPILQTVLSLPTPSMTESGYIDSGVWTAQLQITGLSDDPTQTAPGLGAQIFTSGQYDNGTPAFDATTDWPVLSTSVVDGATIASGSTMKFNGSYITNGTFITGTAPDPLVLSFNFGGVPIELHLHDAIITFDHSAPTDLTNGTIAGVLDAQDLVTTLEGVAGQLSTSLCGSAFDGVAQQILQASDIMNDGTNGPGQTCNGISIGIGFDAKRVANPTKVVPPPAPPPNPCP